MRIASLLGFLLLCFAAAAGQEKLPMTAQIGDVRLMADQMNTTADVITMKGNVRAIVNGVAVYADEATWELASGELRPQGNVRIRVQEARKAKPFETQINGPTDMPLRMPDSPWQGQRH